MLTWYAINDGCLVAFLAWHPSAAVSPFYSSTEIRFARLQTPPAEILSLYITMSCALSLVHHLFNFDRSTKGCIQNGVVQNVWHALHVTVQHC